MTTANEYKRCTVYVHDRFFTAFQHTVHPDKDSAMNELREMKKKLGEPTIGFTENEKADVLAFRFPGTSIFGRIVFAKKDLEEYIHCPCCGVALRRNGDNHSTSHDWYCEWEFDHDNQIWRVHTLTKGGE